MDPEATLKRIRVLYKGLLWAADQPEVSGPSAVGWYATVAEQAFELAELTQALDEWLTKGGFKPVDWTK